MEHPPAAATPASGGTPLDPTGDQPGNGRARPVLLRLSTWSLVRGALIVAAGVVVLRAVLAASTLVWWLAIATVLAGAFQPVVAGLRRWLPGWAAITIVVLAAPAVTGLVGYRGVAELTAQFDVLRDNALEAARSIQSSPQYSEVATEFGLVDKTTDLFDGMPVVLGGAGDGEDAAATVQTAASSGSALFAIATFAVLMLIFGTRFVQAGLEQIDDPGVRSRVAVLVSRSYHASYRYVWLMAARAVAVGVVGGVLCAVLGLDTPTALGVGFAALSIIPGLGVLLAAIPIAVYLSINSVAIGLAVIAGAAVLQALETTFVQRRIDAASVQVGPTATLVAALIGLQMYGVGGLLVGLAAAVYGFAVLAHLTQAHDEVFTAVRQLVGDRADADAGARSEGEGEDEDEGGAGAP